MSNVFLPQRPADGASGQTDGRARLTLTSDHGRQVRPPRPRIAIAHDYLTQMGGAERVVLSFARAFPDAPIYTTLYEPDTTFPEFRDLDVRVSALDKVALLRRHHRAALPLLPFAARSLRIDADVVIASSSGWAHGFTTDAQRLVYCHTPARWLYLADDFLGDHPSRLSRSTLRVLTPGLRRWDRRAAQGATRYVANSSVVQARIRDCYGIDASVLAPPYRLDVGAERRRPEALDDLAWPDFHLVVSRLRPYKHVDQVLRAWRNLPDERLVVVGSGPLADQLRAVAPPNVVLLEQVPEEELRWLYANAVALLAASHEDFGLTVIEAAAFGTPTLALRSGGYLDTVVEGRTGLFFETPTADAIAAAVRRHRQEPLSRLRVSDHAANFSEASFIDRMRATAGELIDAHDEDARRIPVRL